ncbi:MAG: prepilin-type N-terminal cleavage/methylation domain-containing protein [Armatimonadetes bacterium]|nr:prepilin-type N-terminal cleavage/methylation domain-containing protein [Armatimonadota bacterium]NIO74855.1 prepilin-type N-terminal cleavage/methylation domain-containing protein [Armatimonadota bacterium]NIO95617.1 prepilin-type N-terminal cleavage/methylation domain-containing protein [Armatimonadota bacterium]
MGKATISDGYSGNRKGFTLVEAMVSVIILAGLLGAVLAIYFTCGQTWRRGISESRAQIFAWSALRRMGPDIREAMSVTPFPDPFSGCGITLQLPARAFDTGERTYFSTVSVDGEGSPYLVTGNKVNYFRGNAAGSPSLSGDRLWRVVTAPDGSEIRRQIVVENLLDNPPDAGGTPKPSFIYWPDIFRLNSVETTITVEAEESGKKTSATIVGETALRNR